MNLHCSEKQILPGSGYPRCCSAAGPHPSRSSSRPSQMGVVRLRTKLCLEDAGLTPRIAGSHGLPAHSVRVSYAAERAAGTPPPDSCHAAGVADSSGSSRASPLPQSSEFPRAALCFHSASRHRLSSATKARSPEGHIHSEGRSEPCSRTRSRNLSARSLALQQAMGSPRSVQRHKRPAPIEPGDRGSRRNEGTQDECGSAAGAARRPTGLQAVALARTETLTDN